MDRRVFILAAGAAAVTAMTSASAYSQEAPRLNPNTATRKQLARIPQLDADLAAGILQKRPFASMVEFDAFMRQRVNESEAASLYEHLFVPVNLNTGTEKEMALIPGMSRRMVHEFLEYRPYADIETFNREIGKYVDEAEVARLRSYVTL